MSRLPIRRLLVPCEWMKTMCAPQWGDKIRVWPVGVDTERWTSIDGTPKNVDVLLYDKIRWDKEAQRAVLINPILSALKKKGWRVAVVRYGFYREEDYRALLRRSKAMVFICEHETQGLAYQEALSCDVPVLAWDSEGFWVDRDYYPNRVKFSPVTSVPYWDERCGMKFQNLEQFMTRIDSFMERVGRGEFQPRAYILDHLTLELCAQRYADLAQEAASQ
jgi:glycosyltransferase involved in cell wall biosynthesis